MQTPAFNVTLVKPPDYVHSLALKEAAEYVHHMIVQCGYKSSFTINAFDPSAINIVFCAHILTAEAAKAIPRRSIIFNSEQIGDPSAWMFESGVYNQLLERHFVWDYSDLNIQRIKHSRKALIRFSYCERLRRTNIRRKNGLSLLFYGATTAYRTNIISRLKALNIPLKTLFGKYEFERDMHLFKSWAVLNIHKSENTELFEPIRCFYPLINGIPVISESASKDAIASDFDKYIFFSDRDDIVDYIAELYSDRRSFASFSEEKTMRFKQSSAEGNIKTAIQCYLHSS